MSQALTTFSVELTSEFILAGRQADEFRSLSVEQKQEVFSEVQEPSLLQVTAELPSDFILAGRQADEFRSLSVENKQEVFSEVQEPSLVLLEVENQSDFRLAAVVPDTEKLIDFSVEIETPFLEIQEPSLVHTSLELLSDFDLSGRQADEFRSLTVENQATLVEVEQFTLNSLTAELPSDFILAGRQADEFRSLSVEQKQEVFSEVQEPSLTYLGVESLSEDLLIDNRERFTYFSVESGDFPSDLPEVPIDANVQLLEVLLETQQASQLDYLTVLEVEVVAQQEVIPNQTATTIDLLLEEQQDLVSLDAPMVFEVLAEAEQGIISPPEPEIPEIPVGAVAEVSELLLEAVLPSLYVAPNTSVTEVREVFAQVAQEALSTTQSKVYEMLIQVVQDSPIRKSNTYISETFIEAQQEPIGYPIVIPPIPVDASVDLYSVVLESMQGVLETAQATVVEGILEIENPAQDINQVTLVESLLEVQQEALGISPGSVYLRGLDMEFSEKEEGSATIAFEGLSAEFNPSLDTASSVALAGAALELEPQELQEGSVQLLGADLEYLGEPFITPSAYIPKNPGLVEITAKQVSSESYGKTEIQLEWERVLMNQPISEYLGVSSGILELFQLQLQNVVVAGKPSEVGQVFEVDFSGVGADTTLARSIAPGSFTFEVQSVDFEVDSALRITKGEVTQYVQVQHIEGLNVTAYLPIPVGVSKEALISPVTLIEKVEGVDYSLNRTTGILETVAGQFPVGSEMFIRYATYIEDFESFSLYLIPEATPFENPIVQLSDVLAHSEHVLLASDLGELTSRVSSILNSEVNGAEVNLFLFAKDTEGNSSKASVIKVTSLPSNPFEVVSGEASENVIEWDSDYYGFIEGFNIYRCDGDTWNPSIAVKLNISLISGVYSFLDSWGEPNRVSGDQLRYPIPSYEYAYALEAVIENTTWQIGTSNLSNESLENLTALIQFSSEETEIPPSN